MSDSVFVGIDVSSQTLEVASSDHAKTWQASNDSTGIEQLVTQLVALQPALVVLEATDGYEFEAACAVQAAGLAVAVVNPRMARDFARACGCAGQDRCAGRKDACQLCPCAAPAPRTRALRQAAGRR